MVQIIYADVSPLNDDDIFNAFYESASEERQKKTDSFRFRKDKNLCLGASAVIDSGLRKYNLCEKEMTYGTYENQKPYFKNAPEIHFNISHSETMAAAAFSDGKIGIDIEKIKDADLKIAKRFFAEEEYKYLGRFTDKEKQNREFYRLWTLKESFMKVTGLGLKLPLNQFCINIDENGVSVKYDNAEKDYFFYEYCIKGYCISVCSENEIKKPDIVSIGFVKGR